MTSVSLSSMSDQDSLVQKIDCFMDDLKHGKLSEQGSFAIASKTLSILRLLVEDSSWNSAQDLMTSIRKQGRALISRCGQTSFSSIGELIHYCQSHQNLQSSKLVSSIIRVIIIHSFGIFYICT